MYGSAFYERMPVRKAEVGGARRSLHSRMFISAENQRRTLSGLNCTCTRVAVVASFLLHTVKPHQLLHSAFKSGLFDERLCAGSILLFFHNNSLLALMFGELPILFV